MAHTALTTITDCPGCEGQGERDDYDQRGRFGLTVCAGCNGSGKVPATCHYCFGEPRLATHADLYRGAVHLTCDECWQDTFAPDDLVAAGLPSLAACRIGTQL